MSGGLAALLSLGALLGVVVLALGVSRYAAAGTTALLPRSKWLSLVALAGAAFGGIYFGLVTGIDAAQWSGRSATFMGGQTSIERAVARHLLIEAIPVMVIGVAALVAVMRVAGRQRGPRTRSAVLVGLPLSLLLGPLIAVISGWTIYGITGFSV